MKEMDVFKMNDDDDDDDEIFNEIKAIDEDDDGVVF